MCIVHTPRNGASSKMVVNTSHQRHGYVRCTPQQRLMVSFVKSHCATQFIKQQSHDVAFSNFKVGSELNNGSCRQYTVPFCVKCEEV